jgi:hypothetical protein
MAYREHVSPAGLGYDIGCGNKAVCTDLRADDIRADVPALMDRISWQISFGMGRTKEEPVGPPGARCDPDRVLRSAARPPRPRRRAARNCRRGQPLRRPARLARAARRAGLLGGPQGRDAGATRPARLRRLDHGRAQRDPRGRRLAPQRRGPVLDGPRRRAGDEPHRGSRPAAQALRGRGIELRGGAADEAPGAYKRLDEVLAAHAGTVRVLHTLTPLGVAMAGAEAVDPYKD